MRVERHGLVDARTVPSEKTPPGKADSLDAQGRAHRDEFWMAWGF
ncbi:hypothetical protein NUM_61570 [Actinocatenispora comari]|uniref:Uncharacterized protein n=1 Tax=Actinocatenispora comari TaxID=2807577 RepID=A0A8J4ALG3_9ACTN|nr:hypothetical protein NUM_61570 [Actinocatenispora comari]